MHFPSTQLRRADDIGALIRWRRETLGLSQQELATRLGVSRKWVNEIEQGRGSAKLMLVLRALQELDVDLYGCVASQQPTPTTPNDIDIDAIADMNLPTARRRP